MNKRTNLEGKSEEYKKGYRCGYETAMQKQERNHRKKTQDSNLVNISNPEFQTVSLISRYQNDTMSSVFMTSPTEVIKVGEPLSNFDEISRNLELAEIIRQMERLADKGEDICIEIAQVRCLLALLKELAIYRLKEAEK